MQILYHANLCLKRVSKAVVVLLPSVDMFLSPVLKGCKLMIWLLYMYIVKLSCSYTVTLDDD